MDKTITIGIGLGDKFHTAFVFDGQDNQLESKKIINKKSHISKIFGVYPSANVAMEAGTHSPKKYGSAVRNRG